MRYNRGHCWVRFQRIGLRRNPANAGWTPAPLTYSAPPHTWHTAASRLPAAQALIFASLQLRVFATAKIFAASGSDLAAGSREAAVCGAPPPTRNRATWVALNCTTRIRAVQFFRAAPLEALRFAQSDLLYASHPKAGANAGQLLGLMQNSDVTARFGFRGAKVKICVKFRFLK